MSQSAQRIATTTQHVPDYDPTEIEPRWRSRWDADRLYRTPDDDERPPYFLLTMLPYTSGDLHIGHWYAMAPSDVAARWKRMQGFNVMFPVAFDAFGLPAENAAIQNKTHPKQWTYDNIERMRRQLQNMGARFDWDPRVRHLRPGVLPLDPVVVPAALPPRPRLSRARRRQLVPLLRHRARQ